MKIRDFGVERWMDLYETKCTYNLAETCVESLTVDQLLTLANKQDSILDELRALKLTYGAIEGSARLREAISAMYARQSPENLIVTHGAIGGNALVYETLVEPGDTVISVLPTYQQHYSIPESYGADVRILKLREENGFLPDLAELRSLVNDRTRLIAINNPNNPTGSLMDESFLTEIGEIARARRVCALRRSLSRHGSGGQRLHRLDCRRVRARDQYRQHVQNILARGTAARLDRRADRTDPCSVDSSRLQHDQRRHDRRSFCFYRTGKSRGDSCAQSRDCPH